MTWPAELLEAMARRPGGVDASRSRLPLAASPASVPDSAMTGHSPSMTGRKLPTRQDRKPPIVSRLIGSPSRPRSGRRQRGQAGDERLAQLERRELRGEPYGAPVAEHEQRGDPADDQRRPPAVADGLAVDRAEPGDPRPRAAAGVDGPARASAPSSRRRAVDRVVAVLGEEDVLEVRLAADDVDEPCGAAAAMTAPIGR